jgi:hypothetical protein
VFVLGVLHVVVVTRDQMAVELAAREGARAAAVAAAPSVAATRAAHAATSLRPIQVTTRQHAARVTVTVGYRSTSSVPIIGAFVPATELSASVTMQREPP